MKALKLLQEYMNIDFGCDMSIHIEECKKAITELQEAIKPKSCDGCKKYIDKRCVEVYSCLRRFISIPDRYEAIAELEEMQQHKSCEGCKYEHKDAYSLPCAACVRNCDSDYYEPKEQ